MSLFHSEARRGLLRPVLSMWTMRLFVPFLVAVAFPSAPKAQPAAPAPGDVSQEPVSAQPGSPQPNAQTTANEPPAIWERDTLTGDWGGVRTSLDAAGVKIGLEEQSELWGNFAGGRRRGTNYNGLTTPSVTVDLDRLIGWPGAKFFVNAFQIHDYGPSADLVGNLQLVSNIEATPGTKLYDLWIEQVLLSGRLNVRLGQEGANDEMMLSQYAALFLNSSFGFPGLPAADLPSGGPNYPIATPFVRASFQATDQITLVGSVYNGDPAPTGTGDPQRRDASGTAFRLNDHVLVFGEVWYQINQDEKASGLPGTYKLGAWYSSSRFADQVRANDGLSLANPASTGLPVGHSPGYAIYGIVDQMLWRRAGTKDQGIGAFLQVMGAPAAFNFSNLFIYGGLNWKAPFAGRDNDVAGLGFAYLGISPALRKFGNDVIYFTGLGSRYNSNETVLEATYLYQATPWLALQPDAQYVINPGAGIPSTASLKPLKNAFAVGVRASIQF